MLAAASNELWEGGRVQLGEVHTLWLSVEGRPEKGTGTQLLAMR